MTFSQLLVLLEAQQLLSCDERDRDIQTQTSAEHTNQTKDSGRNCLIWNSLQASFPFGGVVPQGRMRGFATCSCVFDSHGSLLASSKLESLLAGKIWDEVKFIEFIEPHGILLQKVRKGSPHFWGGRGEAFLMKLCPTNGWRRGPMKPLLALDFFKKKNSLQTVRI